MMDQAITRKQFQALVAELDGTYQVMYDLLARLPIPMLVIEHQGDNPIEAIRTLARAHELVDMEELDEPFAVQVRAMIADWLTGYELAVAVETYGPALHRVIGLKAALARFSTSAYYVASRLG